MRVKSKLGDSTGPPSGDCVPLHPCFGSGYDLGCACLLAAEALFAEVEVAFDLAEYFVVDGALVTHVDEGGSLDL